MQVGWLIVRCSRTSLAMPRNFESTKPGFISLPKSFVCVKRTPSSRVKSGPIFFVPKKHLNHSTSSWGSLGPCFLTDIGPSLPNMVVVAIGHNQSQPTLASYRHPKVAWDGQRHTHEMRVRTLDFAHQISNWVCSGHMER